VQGKPHVRALLEALQHALATFPQFQETAVQLGAVLQAEQVENGVGAVLSSSLQILTALPKEEQHNVAGVVLEGVRAKVLELLPQMEAEEAQAGEPEMHCHRPAEQHEWHALSWELFGQGFPLCGGKAWGKGRHCGNDRGFGKGKAWGKGKGCGKGPLHFLKFLSKGFDEKNKQQKCDRSQNKRTIRVLQMLSSEWASPELLVCVAPMLLFHLADHESDVDRAVQGKPHVRALLEALQHALATFPQFQETAVQLGAVLQAEQVENGVGAVLSSSLQILTALPQEEQHNVAGVVLEGVRAKALQLLEMMQAEDDASHEFEFMHQMHLDQHEWHASPWAGHDQNGWHAPSWGPFGKAFGKGVDHHGFPPRGAKAWGKGEHDGSGKGWGKGPLHFLKGLSKGLGKGFGAIARDIDQILSCSTQSESATPMLGAQEEADKIAESLQQLADMGFANEELNQELLARHGNDVSRVVDELFGSRRP